MRARNAMTAEWSELGIKSAASKGGRERFRKDTRPRSSGIVSSIPGIIETTGATAGRATTAITPSNARRTSAIAGWAITASPTQFGAKMIRRGICGTVRFSVIYKDPLLSVVMPVYNERTTIDEIVRRVQRILVDHGK